MIEKLETGSKTAIDWFEHNEMIVNPGKFIKSAISIF